MERGVGELPTLYFVFDAQNRERKVKTGCVNERTKEGLDVYMKFIPKSCIF